jgi:hypothetical protein
LLAAHNRNLKLINRGADWDHARHNYNAGDVVACGEAAGGMCWHGPAVVSDKHTSGLRCPS